MTVRKRRPVNKRLGNELVGILETELPPYALDHLQGALSGDLEAGASLVIASPNRWRGHIALAAYYIGLPNPAYGELVRLVWNHDHDALIFAVDGCLDRVRRMLSAGQFKHPFTGQLAIFRGEGSLDTPQEISGISWSTSRDVACWFAYWSARGQRKPFVFAATIDSADILLYEDERKEKEIVPQRVTGATLDSDPATWADGRARHQAAIDADNALRMAAARKNKSKQRGDQS